MIGAGGEVTDNLSQSKEKELPRNSGITPEFDWRPQGDSNPRYRRERADQALSGKNHKMGDWQRF
jgi:hypothetical protein